MNTPAFGASKTTPTLRLSATARWPRSFRSNSSRLVDAAGLDPAAKAVLSKWLDTLLVEDEHGVVDVTQLVEILQWCAIQSLPGK